MSTIYPLEQKLAAAWPPERWADLTVLLAVSGGRDSVALLRAMAAIRGAGAGRLCVVHVNHQLRPDSDADEAFVAALCRELGVSCEVGRIRVEHRPDGIEAAARAGRYQFLKETAGRLGARYVATAHTADDQVETILHRIIRGTGVGGLAGMSRVRPLGHAALIRPLLGIERAELTAYLGALSQPFREDASNADLQFTRNRIRHELLPWLAEQFNPSVKDAVLRLGRLAGEAQALVDALVNDLLETVQVEEADAVCFALAKLARQPRGVIRQLLRAAWRRQGWPLQAMGLAQWEQLADMLVSACAGAVVPRCVFPGNISADVAAGQFRLTKTR